MSCPIDADAPEYAPSDTSTVQNPMDPSTFVFPQPLTTTSVIIEFCDRVRSRYASGVAVSDAACTVPVVRVFHALS